MKNNDINPYDLIQVSKIRKRARAKQIARHKKLMKERRSTYGETNES